jgi:RHS repeat-associated protein
VNSEECIVKHIYLGSQRIASIEESTSAQEHKNSTKRISFFHEDHLGSASIVTNNQGKVIQKISYKPFGEFYKVDHLATWQTGKLANYLFNGKELDNTGLYYYGARYYDPELSRFTQPDTIIQAPYDSQSLNRYAYCRNNPINLIDPTGNFFWFAVGAFVGALIGGLSAHFTGGNVWKGVGFGALTGAISFGTLASATAPILPKLSSGLGFISFVSSKIPDPAFQEFAKYTGYASLACAGLEVLRNVAIWLNEPNAGLYNIRTGKEVVDPSTIPPQSGIAISGWGTKDINDAMRLAKDLEADYVFFNPSHGLVGDFIESALEWITGTGSVDRQLADILSQLKNPVILLPHSQGTIITTNALLKLGLSGKRMPLRSGVIYNALAVNQLKAYPAAWLAGIRWADISYQIKLFDPIAIPALSLNPIELLTGAIGLGFFGWGVRFHGAANYAH